MRICTVCSHGKRAEIEAMIVSGTSYRDISGQFQLSKTAVQRHATDHIPQSIKQAQTAKEEAQSLDVVRQLKAINNVTLSILKKANDSGKDSLALFAVDRVMKQLELQAKLLGDINDGVQINIHETPEWIRVRTTIIQALLPYPEARIAVAQALIAIEAAQITTALVAQE